jgi:hypothetical protein
MVGKVTLALDGLAGPGADLKDFYNNLAQQAPLGRNGQPFEIFVRALQRWRAEPRPGQMRNSRFVERDHQVVRRNADCRGDAD